jgi:3-phenylpropionate/trans-cinnamate dioxygenase ferredoxin subunit
MSRRVLAKASEVPPGTSKIVTEFIRCPWHGWEFDIRTGQSWCDPKSMKARNFKVQVEPGTELVKGPYVAETFAVTVEDDYLVIDL